MKKRVSRAGKPCLRPRFVPALAAAWLLGNATVPIARAEAVALTVTVDGQAANRDYTSVQDALSVLSNQTVSMYFSSFSKGYTESSAASAQVNYLDVGIRYGFAANSNTLVLSIPVTGFTRSFTSDTRQNSNRLLRDFLSDNGKVLLQSIEEYRIRNSPSSPVAGNPSSLQANLIDQGFASLSNDASDAPSAAVGAAGKSGGGAQVGFEAGSFSTGRLNGSNYTLPLSYEFELNKKSHLLRLSAPLTYTDIEGSRIFSGSLGASYRLPLNKRLSLQSGFTYGAVYSEDLLQLVQLVGSTVGLSYRIDLGGASVTPSVLVGNVRSVPFQISRYAFDVDINSYTVKMGQVLENDVQLFGYPIRLQTFAAYTQIFGQQFFVQNYADFGFNLGLLAPKGNAFTRRLRIGFIVTASDTYNATRLSFGYRF